MTNEEKVEYLLKKFSDENGNIDLSDIDFGDRDVVTTNIKAKRINNIGQEAKRIYNSYQKANVINNIGQEADEIFNSNQEANVIYNDNQVIKPNYETMSKEQLIARIKELEDENKKGK